MHETPRGMRQGAPKRVGVLAKECRLLYALNDGVMSTGNYEHNSR